MRRAFYRRHVESAAPGIRPRGTVRPPTPRGRRVLFKGDCGVDDAPIVVQLLMLTTDVPTEGGR
jgi:hypothetical protein